jgi:CTP:molybdopterin cytidylyltransferase MocA
VLAAGRARRFGGAKLLAPFRGRPLAAHAFDVARQARAAGVIHDVVGVIPAGDPSLAELVRREGGRAVVNDTPDLGLSSSLRCGLAALGMETGAVVVLLADQPLVRVEVLARLADAWRGGLGVLVRPRYADAPREPGHPVLVDRALWALAGRLEGESGFGSLPSGSVDVTVIDVPGRNPDVDTPHDLTTLEGSSS